MGEVIGFETKQRAETPNAIQTVEGIVPSNYDFDKGKIRSATTVCKILLNIVFADEVKVVTRKNGSKHFMARCKGTVQDDIADFVLLPDSAIEFMFTGSDNPNSSDWIFEEKGNQNG